MRSFIDVSHSENLCPIGAAIAMNTSIGTELVSDVEPAGVRGARMLRGT